METDDHLGYQICKIIMSSIVKVHIPIGKDN